MAFEDLGRAHPDLDLLAIAEQLSWLDGVVLLSSDPPALTLTDSLRAEPESVE